MKILVLNCGSSSIKYKLFDLTTDEVAANGVVDKIGLKGSAIKFERPDGQKVLLEGEILDHQTGIEYILGVMTSEKHGCIKDLEEISAVGHRVVHGGEKFNGSVLVTDEVVDMMEKCISLAPLHNPPNLKGIESMKELLPDIPQVAVFDTAFHQTMPDYAYMYGIPYSLYQKYSIRRYGFHGTSHRFVSEKACEFLNRDFKSQRIITCHLGNGASIAAIAGGVSLDTSMGFTPVEGLIMGTRAGDLDLGAATYIMDNEHIGTASLNTLINKHSGVLGISGVSSDFRELEKSAYQDQNERSKLAINMFTYRIKKYIGSYIAALGGVDILVFTGGIGENDTQVRAMICDNMDYLGIKLNEEVNSKLRGKEAQIQAQNAKVKILVIPTDEELMIARDTNDIVTEIAK